MPNLLNKNDVLIGRSLGVLSALRKGSYRARANTATNAGFVPATVVHISGRANTARRRPYDQGAQDSYGYLRYPTGVVPVLYSDNMAEPDHAWVPGRRWPNAVFYSGKIDGFNGRGDDIRRAACSTCGTLAELAYVYNAANDDFSTELQEMCRTCWWAGQESTSQEMMWQHEMKIACPGGRQLNGKIACVGGSGLLCPAHRFDFSINAAIVELARRRGARPPEGRAGSTIGSNHAIKCISDDDDKFLTGIYRDTLASGRAPQHTASSSRKRARDEGCHVLEELHATADTFLAASHLSDEMRSKATSTLAACIARGDSTGAAGIEQILTQVLLKQHPYVRLAGLTGAASKYNGLLGVVKNIQGKREGPVLRLPLSLIPTANSTVQGMETNVIRLRPATKDSVAKAVKEAMARGQAMDAGLEQFFPPPSSGIQESAVDKQQTQSANRETGSATAPATSASSSSTAASSAAGMASAVKSEVAVGGVSVPPPQPPEGVKVEGGEGWRSSRLNGQRIYDEIAQRGSASLEQLAQALHVAPSALLPLVEELQMDGLIYERGGQLLVL